MAVVALQAYDLAVLVHAPKRLLHEVGDEPRQLGELAWCHRVGTDQRLEQRAARVTYVVDDDMTAIGVDGLSWATRRLCVDDLRITGTSPTAIVCTCDNLGGSPTITLDPRTGEQIDETDLRTFWPPDALA